MENITREEALRLLNAPERLENLKRLVQDAKEGRLPLPETHSDVNNHIHTTYSFSPYSPTAAVWFSWQAGLCTCGLMDHDSIGGAEEFLEACHIVGMPGTMGLECRASMSDTPFGDRRLNNPDQKGCAYLTLHGVPHDKAGELNACFGKYRDLRNRRNRKMVEGINGLLRAYGIEVDFDRDVLPLSNYAAGGSVTERHLSCALAKKLLERYPAGADLISFIKNDMRLPVSGKIEGYLLDGNNPHRLYDLIGWIKAQLISRFYVDAKEELMDIRDVLDMADRIGAIASYAYLGDVGDSVTGDKKAQTFEDECLDELFPYLKEIGFKAVSYMPSRNTPAQLDRLRALCDRYQMFQISGEDINQPRQAFVCMAQRDPKFSNLYEATWALIAHEWLSTGHPEKGFFSKEAVAKIPDMKERIAAYAKQGWELTF